MSTDKPLHVRLDPQPPWARFQDIIVRLDTGELVAVAIDAIAEPTGATAVIAYARAIGVDGKTLIGLDGLPVAAQVQRPYQIADLQAAGLRLSDLQRDCVRVVLGEPTSHFFTDPAEHDERKRLSIRNRLRISASRQ
ncbi:MAG: hypothetical protein ABI114_07415 [Rhodanobacter sp.]